MQILVNIIRGKSYVFDVEASYTIEMIKNLIEVKTNTVFLLLNKDYFMRLLN